jgi:hypothetical protein
MLNRPFVPAMVRRISCLAILFRKVSHMDTEAVPLTGRQMRALFIPGTVALPSPIPCLGMISFRSMNGSNDPRDVLLVRVEETVGLHNMIARIVRAPHVAAIYYPQNADNPDLGAGDWIFGPDVAAKVGEPRRGIVFVAKDAPVLIQAEFGMTAEESAQYPLWYPCPGCDDDRTVQSYRYDEVMSQQQAQ